MLITRFLLTDANVERDFAAAFGYGGWLRSNHAQSWSNCDGFLFQAAVEEGFHQLRNH